MVFRTNPIFILTGGLFVLVAMMFIIVFGDNGWLDLRTLNQERDHLIEKKSTLFQENVILYRQIDRLKNDLHYIELTARRELGIVDENELIIKIKPPKEKHHVKR